ncbi:MAG: winged helix-turn-helix transcriptional regulator [Candidatus Woesearchaeota archaeon]
MVKITKNDEVILTNLGFNARMSESELGRLCRKSKDTIKYRIKRLESLGIIKGYTVLLDYTKLGAVNYKMYIQTPDPQPLINFFDQKSEVFARFTAYADWNIGVALFCRTPQEYYKIENELFTKFGKDIRSLLLCHMVSASIFSWRAFDKRASKKDIFGDIVGNDLDEMDVAILNLLLADSRQSFVYMAQTLKTNVNMIRRKMAVLEKKGILVACQAIIDTAKLGFENYKLFITVQDYTPEAERSLLETISIVPQCSNVIRMLGPWKIEAEFSCKSYDEFHAIMKKVQQHPAVLGLRYAIFKDEKYFPSGKVLA